MNKGKRYLSIIVLIFSITSVITCNKLPFNGNQKSIDILNGLGVLLILNSTNSKLDSKFQSSNAKSFYRKNGSRQYQDLFIDYTLKEPKLNSEIIEAYIGNEDEIIYDQQNNKVIGHFDKKIDEFETNSILFSHSDINKKLKIILTLQQEGKIVSIQEFKTTGVTPPVIPPNSILLPSILVKTTLPYTTHPYQAIEVKFENPPNISEYTSLIAYLGRPSLITLEPNNFDVSNYLQVAYYNRDFHKFLFTTPELTSPFKIIVVGVTASGKGNRIIDTIPPIPIDHCSGSENIPATFGNCDSFCLKVDLIGNQMEFYLQS
jgi:hypothetical protein